MAELGYYAQLYPSINGAVLGEVTETSFRSENTDQDVMTLLKNYAGVTPGPLKGVLSLTFMIPESGLEVDIMALERARGVVDFGMLQSGSGQRMLSKGFVRNTSLEAGVGQNARATCEIHGEFNIFS